MLSCVCGTCCGGNEEEEEVHETEALVREATSGEGNWLRMAAMRPGASGAAPAPILGPAAAPTATSTSSSTMDSDMALARSLQEAEMATAFLQALASGAMGPPAHDQGGAPVFHPSAARAAARGSRLARLAAAQGRQPQEMQEEAAARHERAARQRILRTLPTRMFVEGSMKEDASCAICLGDYAAGEKIRTLPCLHVYHQECVDMWLLKKGLCPSCNWSISSTEFGAF
eukprot:tig00000367_g24453.t1